MRAPIHSVKHYVQTSLTTVAGPSILAVELVNSVIGPDADSVSEVREGAIVKAVYVEYWLRAAGTSPGTAIVTLEKTPGIGTVNMSAAQSSALGSYPNKKNIFYTFMGLINDQDADAIGLVRQWIKIPKSKQRFGLNDKLFLNVHSNTTVDILLCGFCTYKEYT